MWPELRTRPSSALELRRSRAPPNNWEDPAKMKQKLAGLFAGSMVGPHHVRGALQHGPDWLADLQYRSRDYRLAYVVVSMHIMSRVGSHVLDALGENGEFVRGLHSVGAPLVPTSRTRLGAATRSVSTFAIFRRRVRSGRLVPVTAAMRYWGRSAMRCASLRCRRATKAGWPSTC